MFRCQTLFLLIVLTHAFYDASSSPLIDHTKNGNINVNNCQTRLKQVVLLVLCQKQSSSSPMNTFGNNMARDCCTSQCSLDEMRKIYCPLTTTTTSSPTSSYESFESLYGDVHSYETLHVQSEEFEASDESPEKSPNMEIHMDSVSDEYNQPPF